MANPFFSALGGKMNIMAMLPQIKANPVQFILSTKGINIPAEVGNDPNNIMQYLLATGKITQQQVNDAYMAAPQNGYRGMY